MVAKITTGKNLYGALSYNQEKVDKGLGKVLASHLVCEPVDGIFRVAETAADFESFLPLHYRTEKPVIHISLNPHPDDKLTDEQLVDIAQEYLEKLEYKDQPYMVFKHFDIEREHIHIVSLQVKSDGKKINDSKIGERSKAITEELEKKYGLHPAEGQTKGEQWKLSPIDPTKGNLKKQIASVVKPAAAMYRFQTLGEYRALLSLYNIGVEEVRGERNSKPYRGLLYTALNRGGNKTGTPLKSSLFGKAVGFDRLENHMEISGGKIKEYDYRNKIRQRIGSIVSSSRSEKELRMKLREKEIDIFLRRNDTGRITGVTFIDHNDWCVMNGSRLGKEFSANVINDLFRESHVNEGHTKQDAGKEQFSHSAEPFVPQHRQSGNDETAIESLLSILSPEPQEKPEDQPIRQKRKKKKKRYGRQM
jgi:hypothetical protein